MEHMNYNKNSVDNELSKALDWQYYGGIIMRSLYEVLSVILSAENSYDKRKTELSA